MFHKKESKISFRKSGDYIQIKLTDKSIEPTEFRFKVSPSGLITHIEYYYVDAEGKDMVAEALM